MTPTGVEPGHFTPHRRDQDLRARMLARCGLPASATLLLGVGRYSPEKRWGMVIDAAIAAGAGSPVGLLLIGDGRSRGSLEARAAGCPHVVVGDQVCDRDQLAAIMASADALVHGCEAETFCIVAAEAAASGLPLIVPDRGGAADYVAGRAGLTYRSADAGALRAAITQLVIGHTFRRPSPTTRSMDDHFTELFGRYAALLPAQRLAA